MGAISPLWIVPVLVVALGVAAVALVAQRLGSEADAMVGAVEDLRILGEEAAALRDDADTLRRKAEAVGDAGRRAAPPPPDAQ